MNNSVTRALRLLELIADNDGAPMRLSALAAAIGAPKSSVHSILRSLVAQRFLEPTDDGCYRLGIRAFEVGSAYSRHMSPTRAVHAELVDLSHELKVTAHFAILDGPEVLYIEKEDPPGRGIRVASAVGARLPRAPDRGRQSGAGLRRCVRGRAGRPFCSRHLRPGAEPGTPGR